MFVFNFDFLHFSLLPWILFSADHCGGRFPASSPAGSAQTLPTTTHMNLGELLLCVLYSVIMFWASLRRENERDYVPKLR